MRFIKEMIQRKKQPSDLVDAIDADLQDMRQNGGAKTAKVPDFADLVADINPPALDQKIVETDDEILALFDVEDDEEWEDDIAEALDANSEPSIPEAVPEIEEFVGDIATETIAFDGPESDVDEQVYEAEDADDIYEEDLYEEIGEETAAKPVEVTSETTSRNIWDMNSDPEEEIEVVAETPEPQITKPVEIPEDPVVVQVPTPAIGRAGRRAGRVKTRLLGFEHAGGAGVDMFAAPDNTDTKSDEKFPVGWIVISQGPGRGASFSLFNGVSQIGRGDDQSVSLDFGDNSISRSNHAAIAYDNEQCAFHLGHGGKANLVRLNNKPVLSTEELSTGDLIRIGETTLRFVALCGADFDWERVNEEDTDDVAFA